MMAIKERKPIFLKVLSIVLVVALINVGYFVYNNINSSQRMTGFSINDINNLISHSYTSLSFSSKVFMIVQWVVLLFILFFAAFRDRRLNAITNETDKANENIDIPIQRNPDKNKTDIDTLYEILMNRKELSISAISKLFNVDRDIALEWCKILESGELVSVSYPAFSEPFVLINEKEIKNIIPEKSNILKDSIKIKKEIEESQPEPEEESEESQPEPEEE